MHIASLPLHHPELNSCLSLEPAQAATQFVFLSRLHLFPQHVFLHDEKKKSWKTKSLSLVTSNGHDDEWKLKDFSVSDTYIG